jgi:hypothetical protein
MMILALLFLTGSTALHEETLDEAGEFPTG